MRKHKASEPSQRMLRVGEQLRHVISETLRQGRFDDPLLFDASAIVTVTEVRVSPDLKHATAYVLALGGGNMDEMLPALNDSAAIFQRDIGRKLDLKFTPKVRFIMDKTFDQALRIETLIGSLPETDRYGYQAPSEDGDEADQESDTDQ
ncbi:30S ribosome-binding factor RbfA [Micavibrio aeruginosavorus]|uniref:Ribosome-binding factor A n=1 Tax=Micavibrio aeruginosavorus (strain ARL-13) TaxID=856793 RepID=G2KNA6_MICAA|nr:30S ribosome-binding factor RbfA [Micavibrio aeruginosavorus]AEP09439.1 ribosome-binding factor A [Micavibrio aeruginosavorus ARL-13]